MGEQFLSSFRFSELTQPIWSTFLLVHPNWEVDVHDLRTSTKQKPTTPASAKSTPPKVTFLPDQVPLHDRIRERAYELYESRGREHGKDEQDWLRAEQEIRAHQR